MENVAFNEEMLKTTIEKIGASSTPKEKRQITECLKRVFTEGITLGEALNIDANAMEFFYAHGYRCYALRKYDAAARMFLELYLLNPHDPRYSLGAAASYQMAKDYENAIGWYLTLSVIDLKSPLPFYYISDCFVKQHQPQIAKNFLLKAIERCENHLEYSQLKERCTRMISGLDQEIEGKTL